MLSILIPTYNYNVLPLVTEVREQCLASQTEFEVIVLDDASPEFKNENAAINLLGNCRYEILARNIGRSCIRNLLAEKASFDWMVFLDADVLPIHKNFIQEYLKHISNEPKVINGGIRYQPQKPETARIFRWVYGSQREALDKVRREAKPYLSFLTLNFMIHKGVFEKVRFNETIPNLRHEDTLFSFDLKKAGVTVEHIDNPVYHLGLDSFDNAIKKENESLTALKYLLKNKLLSPDYVRIGHYYTTIKKAGLSPLFSAFHKITKPIFLRNLGSASPSMFLFDLYRLGYLFTIDDNRR